MSALAQLCINLALSIAVEGALAYLLFRSKRFCYCVLLCNLLTNPIVNLLLFLVIRFYASLYWPALVILELGVVLEEAYIYRLLCGMPQGKSLKTSLLLNAASYGVGYLLWNVVAHAV